jgi:hypothetical protein
MFFRVLHNSVSAVIFHYHTDICMFSIETQQGSVNAYMIYQQRW